MVLTGGLVLVPSAVDMDHAKTVITMALVTTESVHIRRTRPRDQVLVAPLVRLQATRRAPRMSLYMLLFAVAISYLILVRTLRYRRISQLQAQHGAISTQFADLKYKDAQKILGQMGLYEFPWIFLAGKDFAFLRVR